MFGDAKWRRQLDRVVARTAERISAEIDKMFAGLPEGAAAQMAIESVIVHLTPLQPWFLELIMEDPNIREAYEAAVARMRATARMGRP